MSIVFCLLVKVKNVNRVYFVDNIVGKKHKFEEEDGSVKERMKLFRQAEECTKCAAQRIASIRDRELEMEAIHKGIW